MKLVLSSCGIINEKLKKETLKLFSKPIKEVKLLFITTAADGEVGTNKDWIEEEFNTILDLGILKENIMEYKIGDPVNIDDYDGIYVLGGNTFYLMDKVRKYDFGKVIKEALEKNKVYIGSSAGSEIVCKSIEMALPYDKNEVELTDMSGLSLVDFAVIPHANKKAEFVKEYSNKSKYKVISLSDGDGIVINE